jgi:hypothetical protein
MGVTLVDPTQIARDDGNGKLMLNGVQVGTSPMHGRGGLQS